MRNLHKNVFNQNLILGGQYMHNSDESMDIHSSTKSNACFQYCPACIFTGGKYWGFNKKNTDHPIIKK